MILRLLALTLAAAPAAASADTGTSSVAPTELGRRARPGEVRSVSWTVKTGKIPAAGGLLVGEMGFSGLPRVSYQHTLLEGFSLGVLLAFDYAGHRPAEAFDPTVVVGLPLRFTLPAEGWDLGLAATLGLRLEGPQDRLLALLVDLETNVGFTIEHRVLIGGGVALPMSLGVGGSGARFDVPILVGPFVEFHPIPPLAVVFDLKAGPHLATSGGTAFGLRTHLGIGYRF